MSKSKIKKAVVAVENDIYEIDAIEFERKLWLVPEWLTNSTEGIMKPLRMVRFDCLQFQEIDNHYTINRPIPRVVLDGEEFPGYEILKSPDIFFPEPSSKN